MLQWMFFEQYSHEPYIAVVLFWHFVGLVKGNQSWLPVKTERGYHALSVMEGHLTDRTFFVGGRYTVVDIALHAYTHVAPEGGFELGGFPAVVAWLERVRSQPDHIRITDEVSTVVSGV